MTDTWMPGDHLTLRGIYNNRVWYVQSAILVQDSPEEVALAVCPGAECAAPEGYINGKHGVSKRWDRWGDYRNDRWSMQTYTWHTNRMLVLLYPGKPYAINQFWHDATEKFLCYYVNFQLPFRRSHTGFDTLDLELDLIVEPTYKWRWKDLEEYHRGVEDGILLDDWVKQIELAKTAIFEKIEARAYPFDGRWLGWRPDPDWSSPKLPQNWDKI